MTFANPYLLWLLALGVPAFGALVIWNRRQQGRALAALMSPRLRDLLVQGGNPKIRITQDILHVFILALLLLAAAGPRWGFAWEESSRKGLDILVALDTSRSMLATDIQPDRLSRAKLAAQDLLRLSPTDRLGLIAFAGGAFLQCPLTLDAGAFHQSLETLDTSIIPTGGSSITAAIETAIDAFREQPDSHRVLVVFSDGEDHDSGASGAASKATEAGIKVFTIGIGTPEGELLRLRDPKGQETFLKDDQGNVVKSRLNESLLREVATAGQGFYLPLRGRDTMRTLYEKGLENLPKTEMESQLIRRQHERYQWPLAAAILLMLVDFLLKPRRTTRAFSGSTQSLAGLILMLGAMPALAGSGNAETAAQSFQSGNYREAMAIYEDLLEKAPEDSRLQYNAASAAYKAGDLDRASSGYQQALRSEDLTLQHDAYYNLGNTLYRRGEQSEDLEEKKKEWEASVRRYEQALELKPEDSRAEHNRQFVLRKLEELKKQEEQSQDQQQQDSSSDSKDSKEDQKDSSGDKSQSPGDDQPKDSGDSKGDQQKEDSQEQEQKGDQQDGSQQPSPNQEDSKDSQEQSGGKPSEEGQGQQDGKEASDGSNSQDSPDGKEGNTPETAGEGAAGMAGQMTIEQALQLLEAQKGETRPMIFRPRQMTRPQNGKPVKDW